VPCTHSSPVTSAIAATLTRARQQRLDRRGRELRLRDEAERGAAGDEPAEVVAVQARGEDRADGRVEAAEPLRDLEAVEVRELDVQQDDVGPVLPRGPDAADAGLGLRDDDEAVALEELPGRRPERAVVVDDQKPPQSPRMVSERASG
jgi:hypothetical protein